MRYLLVTSLLATTIGLASSCAPKVDCKKLESRLDKCTAELIWALKPDAKANFEKNPQTAEAGKKLAQTVEKLRKSLKTDVYKPCKQHQGRAKDAAQINKCLKKDSCEAFAQCFAKYLKGKSKKK